MLTLLIGVLVYPAVGSFFANKGILRSRGGDQSDDKEADIGRLR